MLVGTVQTGSRQVEYLALAPRPCMSPRLRCMLFRPLGLGLCRSAFLGRSWDVKHQDGRLAELVSGLPKDRLKRLEPFIRRPGGDRRDLSFSERVAGKCLLKPFITRPAGDKTDKLFVAGFY